ncbi:MAG TPA: ligase-associated DNA damage response exonuclease [Ohtaekwangia sp.]|nr:ligase-associated DNA damage response exonuclease [Ohtaekwangia sp.]
MSLLDFTDRGIYCPAADVYLDPWKPVKRAIISHGHSDHASWGHGQYLCTVPTAPIIRHRLSLRDNVQAEPYGRPVFINGVRFSFHPAGHIPGSAQIRVERNGEVWVFSGDYKLEADHLSEPFEQQRCQVFITESTFGLPVYRWHPQEQVVNEINTWWRKNQLEGKISVIAGYTLGKSQRIIKNVDASIGKIFVHGAVDVMNDVLRQQGIALPETHRVTKETKKQEYEGALVVCPPSAVGSPWIRRFLPYSLGIASGWMLLRGARRRRGADRGFVLSDHADWNDLNSTVRATGAERVFVTHGYSEVFTRWLNETGIEAQAVKTEYEGELGEMSESAETAVASDA